jgi:PucR C-terminal helix-turn-helix domain/GGDEF-like domain/GAF domain
MVQTLPERLKSLAQIASLVNSGTALGEVLERIALAVCQRSAWSSSAIMALDETAGYSTLVARHDPLHPRGAGGRDRWALATSPSRQVLADRKTLVIPDAQAAPDYPGYAAEARERDYRTVVLLPLGATDEQGRGMVMSVHAHVVQPVDADELAFLGTVSELASLAVEKAHLVGAAQAQARHLRGVLELHATAMERVLAGGTAGDLAALAGASLSLPLLLVDFTTNRALADRSPIPAMLDDGAWQALLEGDGYRHFASLVAGATAGQFERGQEVSLRSLGVKAVLSAMIEPCLVEGAVLGGIVIFTGGRALDAAEALVAQGLRFALAVALLRAHVRFASQAETHGEFFARLFSGNWRDRAETMARAGHLGLKLEAPARLALLALPETKSPAAPRDDLVRALLRVARAGLPAATAFFDGEAFVLFLPAGRMDAKAVGRLLQRLVDELERQAGLRPTAVLSRACASLEDYREARVAAARTLDLARRLDRSGIVAEADFGPFARLVSAADQAALRRFVADTIGRLEAHDRAHASELVATLEAFFAEQGRYQATADALGIHVTTLRYRLRRLGELFAISLEDPETRIAIEVALRMRRTLGAS